MRNVRRAPVKMTCQSQLRGPNCADGTLEEIAFSHQRLPLRHLRIAVFGFRVVLAKEATKQEVA